MRLFQVLPILCLTCASQAFPRYHATKIDTEVAPVDGFANDGSIAYAKSGYGEVINYNGQIQSVNNLIGRYVDFQVTIQAHDVWTGNFYGGGAVSYYKGNARFIPKMDGNEQEYIGCTNENGDIVGTHVKFAAHPWEFNQSYSFYEHNGVRTNLEPYTNNFSCPNWITNNGWISGQVTKYVYSTLLQPSDTGYTIDPINHAFTKSSFTPVKINERGTTVMTAKGSSVLLLYADGNYAGLKGPDGYDTCINPDINNLNQAVYDARSGHSAVLWENGQAVYLDSLVDNPDVLPPLRSFDSWDQPKINDSGVIAAVLPGATINGVSYHDVWRFDPIAVPEPGSLAPVLLGLVAMTRRRRSS